MRDEEVLIKPNFNTSDPAPGSTHNDTLVTMLDLVAEEGPRSITVADRSGPAATRKVFEEKGILMLAKARGFSCLLVDELPDEHYEKVRPPGSHWKDGFLFARAARQARCVICLCCLKTHQYGGHFTMSLKLATGLVHRRNMDELHSSRFQREMIAEMNYAYRPSLAIMDGVEAFYSGGPMRGPVWKANLTFASRDRVALDAVGVAALKLHGTTPEIERKRVFEQDQIKRALELGLGAREPKEVELVPVDAASEGISEKIRSELMA